MNGIKHWEELPEGVLEGDEHYSAVEKGWVNTKTRAEVLVFRTAETNLESEISKKWAIAHPWEEKGNIMFRSGLEEAIEAATEWMEAHPHPTSAY